LYFKGLLILKLEERKCIVLEMHHEIRHFGQHQTFAKVYKRFYWHNQTKQVKMVVKACKECQMVKCTRSIKYDVEDLKNIPIYDLYYRVELDIVGPFLETQNGNKYILVAIDHYSKWCEAKLVLDHIASMVVRFLEEEIICRYEVLKFILIDNGGEWST
jgi:hypothetical protein